MRGIPVIIRDPDTRAEGTMTQRRVVVQVAAAIVLLLVAPGAALAARGRTQQASADLLLALDVRPFAIAHRGFGENLGTDPTRPIENTGAAVEQGFEAGDPVVEVNAPLTPVRPQPGLPKRI